MATHRNADLVYDVLQEAVYFKKLRDSDEDMLEAILRAFDAAPKHNPRLLGIEEVYSAGGEIKQVGSLSTSLSIADVAQQQGYRISQKSHSERSKS